MKTITLSAPQPLLDVLCEAITVYAGDAYPVGGSECAQAARAGLLDTVERIRTTYDVNNQSVTISRRIKAHIRSSVEYYAQRHAEGGDAQSAQHASAMAALLLDCLSGQVIELQQWQALAEGPVPA